MNKLSVIGNMVESSNQIHDSGMDFLFRPIDGSGFIEELVDCNIIEDKQVVVFNIKVDAHRTKKLIKQFKDKHVRFCIFITTGENHFIDRKRLGAKIYGFLLKNNLISSQSNGISVVMNESKPLKHKETERMLTFVLGEPVKVADCESRLTNREVETMELLSRGLLYKEIARSMGISDQTVKSHVKHIYQKFRVCNRSEAILRFLQAI